MGRCKDEMVKLINGAKFVEKKYVGESIVDNAKLTIIKERYAIDTLGVDILSI